MYLFPGVPAEARCRRSRAHSGIVLACIQSCYSNSQLPNCAFPCCCNHLVRDVADIMQGAQHAAHSGAGLHLPPGRL